MTALARWRRPAAIVVLGLLLLAAATNDPLAERQYHIETIRAPAAWEVSRGARMVVAVVDTGVDLDHPDLAPKIVRGVDLVQRGTRPRDPNGHGTLVAGIIASIAGNAEGGAGVAPDAMIMPVRVLNRNGEGTSDVVAEGIRWAADNGADVINLSLAEVPGQQRSPTALITTDVELAIRQAHNKGVVVVAAAGNEGRRRTPYNAGVPVIVVGATDRDDRVWRHSNGDADTLYAPGVEIASTYRGGSYALADGTSFAAPMAAGAAAVVLAAGLPPAQVASRLSNTAVDIGRGAGRLDLAAAAGAARRQRAKPQPPAQSGDRQRSGPQPVRQVEPSPIAPQSQPEQQTEVAPAPAPAPTEPVEPDEAEPVPEPTITDPPPDEPEPAPTPAESARQADLPVDAEPGGPSRLPVLVAGTLLGANLIGLVAYALDRRTS